MKGNAMAQALRVLLVMSVLGASMLAGLIIALAMLVCGAGALPIMATLGASAGMGLSLGLRCAGRAS